MIEKKNHPLIFEMGSTLDIFNNDMNIVGDWRIEFREYLLNPNKRVLPEGELYRKGLDGLWTLLDPRAGATRF